MKNPNPPGGHDQAAMAALVRYRDRIRRFLTRRSWDAHSANDLTQEVYLRLLRFPPQMALENPQAYLYRIASNVLSDFNLHKKSDHVLCDSSTLEELAESISDIWSEPIGDQLDAARKLDSVLRTLPAKQQAALLLRKRDGLSYTEIAQEMNISIHTVKKYIALAVANCRTAERDGRTRNE